MAPSPRRPAPWSPRSSATGSGAGSADGSAGVILAGEYVGAGVGFAVTGDIAALSWRAAFVILALPAFVLAVVVWRLREPERGGKGVLAHDSEPRPVLETGETTTETDAQRLAREQGFTPDPDLVIGPSAARRMGLVNATRYVLRVRTNIVLIAASACGYYFLAGLQTFGLEFSKEQYGIDQALASSLLLLVGAGSLAGVLAGGALGDRLLKRGLLSARVLTPAVAAAVTTALFIPALLTRGVVTAVPYLIARRASSSACRTRRSTRLGSTSCRRSSGGARRPSARCSRSLFIALAPLLFGATSDYVFGGGRSGLQWTFAIMLLPAAASSWLLFKGPAHVPGRRRHGGRRAPSEPRRAPGEREGVVSTGNTFLPSRPSSRAQSRWWRPSRSSSQRALRAAAGAQP